MAHPTIIIGIGSSGLKVLEEVQKFHYESFRKNKPEHTEYLYLETNKDNRVGITALENEIKRVYISLSQMSTMIQNLKTRGDADWIPDLGSLINNSLGAGGIRPCGRLALWGKNQEGDNFVNVTQAIQEAYWSAVKNSEVTKPTVFIVGSTTGGTGSGVFLDVAYLVREIITDIKELFGLFLIPPRPSTIINNEVMYANTYGVMKDLHYFNRAETHYKEHWPSGKKIKDPRPPFELTQFISQEYSDGTPGIKTLSGLYKMAGLYLFLNIAGMRDKRMERLVDAAGNSHIGKYGTFGLSAIQFPKDQIQEYLAVKKSIELLKRWTDSRNYLYQNKETPINANLIRDKVAFRWDAILGQAFAILDSAAGKELITEIEDEALNINKGDYKKDPVKHIRSLFHMDNKDGYYQVVQNNLSVAFNSIIKDLHDWFQEMVNETENLEYAKVFLRQLIQVLKDTIEYWNKDLKVSSDTARWQRFLTNEAKKAYKDGIFLPRHKETGQQNLVLRDRMINLFEMMKVHLMEDKLRQIGKNISTGEKDLFTTTSERLSLPRLNSLNAVIQNIKQTVDEADDQMRNEEAISLNQRLHEIETDISDQTIPIHRIYKSGGFEEEIAQADNDYKNKEGNQMPSKATLIGQKDLWQYLNSMDFDFAKVLYNESIQSFRRKIVELDCVQDYEVEDYVNQFPNEGERMAKKAIQALIQIGNDKVMGKSPYLPRFLVGADKSKLSNMIEKFNNRNFSEFSNSGDGVLEMKNLRNIVVFYDEKGNYLPLQDIRYIDQLKKAYEEYPIHIQEMTEEKWKQDRNAYLTPEPKAKKKK